MLTGAEFRVLVAAFDLKYEIEHAEKLIAEGSCSPSDYRLAALGRALRNLPPGLQVDYVEACQCQPKESHEPI